MYSKQLFNLSRRGFTASIYNYTSASNPRVFLSVANGDQVLGDLVFELYANRVPQTAENFAALCEGTTDGRGYAGSSFVKGFPGGVIQGGRLGEENVGADGARFPDEDLSLRHTKRGQLTMYNNGENSNGSEFQITFGEARYLDGYQSVFGELVEGESVLAKLEESVNRLGQVTGELKIVASGLKQ